MSKTIVIQEENAVLAYEKASKNGKALLVNLLGKKVFQKDVMERITSWEDVCADQGKNPKDYIITSTDPDDIAANAYKQALLIVRCFNEGKECDWTDSKQYKYFMWLKFSASSGWSFYDYAFWYTGTHCGSRLGFLNSAHPEHCFKLFPEIFTNYFK